MSRRSRHGSPKRREREFKRAMKHSADLAAGRERHRKREELGARDRRS
jgi:hypothetical protein